MMTRLVLAAMLAACAGKTHEPRFAIAPAVVAVSDTHDVKTAPAPRTFSHGHYQFRGHFLRRAMRGFELRRDQRSLGVNALDEVPDSTWFTNRIGVRDVSPDEIQTATTTVGSPEAHLPWTIHSTKVGGVSVGFIIKDARGEKFILKFDEKALPELETASDAITSRLVWAAGYNVAEDHVVYFKPTDLVLAPNAKIKDVFGNERPLKKADLDRLLAKVSPPGADGRIRGLTSSFIKGTWLGGHPDHGVRADDPNDKIPHERRRELRGARAIFAWLDHIDTKEDNSVDMWVADPNDPSRHYVKHYFLDFGKSLGAMSKSSLDPRRSYAYQFDLVQMGRSLATLGLAERQWDNRVIPDLRGVGLLDSATFSPPEWKPNTPSYLPFLVSDDIDGYWGAKILMRFTREQIRAAVDMGKLSDPRSADYIVDTLVERQRVSGRYWFSRVAPLDNITVASSNGALCFDDLLLTYKLAQAAKITTYEVTSMDRNERVLSNATVKGTASGRACLAPLAMSGDADGYTIVKLRTRRHSFDASTYVHLARSAGTVRVIGIYRETAAQAN